MTALGAIFLAGVAGLVVGGLLAAWPGRLGPGFAIQALGTALLGVSGAAVLTGAAPLGAPFNSDVAPALGLDALSGFFVLVLAITAVPTLVFAPLLPRRPARVARGRSADRGVPARARRRADRARRDDLPGASGS